MKEWDTLQEKTNDEKKKEKAVLIVPKYSFAG